jgi:2-dehydro-3-deoxygluconokinase
VVDKVGSGDCFMAGLIYGISTNHTATDIISFAAAAAFGKLQEKGDATQNSVKQIENILILQKQKKINN